MQYVCMYFLFQVLLSRDEMESLNFDVKIATLRLTTVFKVTSSSPRHLNFILTLSNVGNIRDACTTKFRQCALFTDNF